MMVERDCGALPVVGECMTSPAIRIREDARLAECVELLEGSQVRRLIVVDADDAICGIVAQADIALHASKRATGDLVRQVSKRYVPAFTNP